VVAGDTPLNQSLWGFGDYWRSQNGLVLGFYDVGSLKQARKCRVAYVDGIGRITSFVEKLAKPVGVPFGIALCNYPRRH
jgi:hypothetical protein